MSLPGESWRDQAACREMDNAEAIFFPPRGRPPKVGSAKHVCGGCPVRDACLDYAISHRIEEGIWGGLAIKDREKVRRARRANR